MAKKKTNKYIYILGIVFLLSIGLLILKPIIVPPVKNCVNYECFDENWNNQYCREITFEQLKSKWDSLCQSRGYDIAISYDCNNLDGVYTGPVTEQFNDLTLQCANR